MCPKKPANCPCPLPDGSCPSKHECDRNNHIGHSVKTIDTLDPEPLDQVKWFASVESQIPEDVVPPPVISVNQPVITRVDEQPPTYPMPSSEIIHQAAAVDSGFMPTTGAEASYAQNHGH